MKIYQIVTTYGQNCGIALFARNLQAQMQKIGIDVITNASFNSTIPDMDLILLHHHSELISHKDVRIISERNSCPVVLFAHSTDNEMFLELCDGFVAMCQGMIPETYKPVYIFSHPAWIPEVLKDRRTIRDKMGLPADKVIIGTNGFLKFERQLPEILSELLPLAEKNDWYLYLITSPWYIESPGLVPQLSKLEASHVDYFRFEHAFYDNILLNQKLQACDLLWCWTRAVSSPYASGVISDQYASGTRIIAADKMQHQHVLKLPNVVKGSDEFESFLNQLIKEIKRDRRDRHDPSPISWNTCIDNLAVFLNGICSKGQKFFHKYG